MFNSLPGVPLSNKLFPPLFTYMYIGFLDMDADTALLCLSEEFLITSHWSVNTGPEFGKKGKGDNNGGDDTQP